MKDHTILEPSQIAATKSGFENLQEQLDFGRFNSVKSGAAPTLYQEIIAVKGQRDVKMQVGSYTMNDHSLQVILNGQVQRSGASNDYIEIDSESIRFNYDLDDEDVVVLRVSGGTSGPLLHEMQQGRKGQTMIELNGSYETGNHSMILFINGAYQSFGVDYIEASSKQIKLIEPLEENDMITIRVEGLPTTVSQYGNTTTISTYDAAGQIIREEVTGGSNTIKEFEYDTIGQPARMIIRENGYIITKIYSWDNGRCVKIDQVMKEVT